MSYEICLTAISYQKQSDKNWWSTWHSEHVNVVNIQVVFERSITLQSRTSNKLLEYNSPSSHLVTWKKSTNICHSIYSFETATIELDEEFTLDFCVCKMQEFTLLPAVTIAGQTILNHECMHKAQNMTAIRR